MEEILENIKNNIFKHYQSKTEVFYKTKSVEFELMKKQMMFKQTLSQEQYILFLDILKSFEKYKDAIAEEAIIFSVSFIKNKLEK